MQKAARDAARAGETRRAGRNGPYVQMKRLFAKASRTMHGRRTQRVPSRGP